MKHPGLAFRTRIPGLKVLADDTVEIPVPIADEAGSELGKLREYLNGRGRLTPKLALMLELEVGVSAEHLIRGQYAYFEECDLDGLRSLRLESAVPSRSAEDKAMALIRECDDEHLFRFHRTLLSSSQTDQYAKVIAKYFEVGIEVTVESVGAAVDAAIEWWSANRPGTVPVSPAPVIKALAEQVNPITAKEREVLVPKVTITYEEAMEKAEAANPLFAEKARKAREELQERKRRLAERERSRQC